MNDSQPSSRSQIVFMLIGAFLIPLILVVGTFFTVQSDLRHLESRLAADEVSLTRDLSSLESRMRAVELDSAERLSAIETTLESIESYLMEIKNYIWNDSRLNAP